MNLLSPKQFDQIAGGQCTGSGSSAGGSVSCTATAYEDKRNKLEIGATSDTRRGPTGGSITWSRKW